MTYFVLCMVLLWMVDAGTCGSSEFIWTGIMPMQVSYVYLETISFILFVALIVLLLKMLMDFAHCNHACDTLASFFFWQFGSVHWCQPSLSSKCLDVKVKLLHGNAGLPSNEIPDHVSAQ